LSEFEENIEKIESRLEKVETSPRENLTRMKTIIMPDEDEDDEEETKQSEERSLLQKLNTMVENMTPPREPSPTPPAPPLIPEIVNL
jgi:hypothetical protein